ncbi:unnamed protein product [Caenorhabditis angaria]|uniref:snRNA-activating protein complex subunit 4 n=1 Tax=Caenorhabditis angaria TaxID=860376 RepID=A0A9P1I481_9PELO|nr:unnamed protein product [Caenorhabditis angaria]
MDDPGAGCSLSSNPLTEELPCDSIEELIAFNEAYKDVIETAIFEVNEKLRENRERQRNLREEQRRLRSADISKKKIPVNLYMPPYFKDEKGMCPPLNAEARNKIDSKWFDPLMKEEKKWTSAEIKMLRTGIKDAIIANSLQSLNSKRDILTNKLKTTNAMTTQCERYKWTMELEEVMRKIEYAKNRKEEEILLPTEDYTNIPWNEIANVTMKGTRTEWAVRSKWLNELSPKWNKNQWTQNEIDKLRDLRESPKFVSWTMLALQLGTNRPAFQCLEKYKSECSTNTREWTNEEDQKLITLTKLMTVNGNIQWEKVAQFMPGRSRIQVRVRFTHSLDANIKHGRWTDQEDMLLISAVSRIGAKDWAKVASAVPGRNDSQCRERWANVLNKPVNVCERFTLAEDEQLLYAVKLFGKGNWAKCSTLLSQKTPRQLRKRYIQLVAAKLKMVAGVCNAVEAMESARRNDEEVQKEQKPVIANKVLSKAFENLAEMDEFAYETPEEMLERVGAPSVSARYQKFRESPNWPIIEKNLQEICQKNTNGQDIELRSNEVLKNLNITDVDVRYMVQQNRVYQKQKAAINWRSRMEYGGGRVRPIAGFKNYNNIVTHFGADVPESEKQMSLIEALCMTVRKHDFTVWGKKFWTSFQYGANKNVAVYIDSMLNEKCLEVANHTKQQLGSILPIKTTLAPNTTTMRLLETIKRAKYGLNYVAAEYFYPIEIGIEEQKDYVENNERKNVNEETRLNIGLSEEIKSSAQYNIFAARMRALLLEPYRMKIAIESVEKEEERYQNDVLVEQRLTDEESVIEGNLEVPEKPIYQCCEKTNVFKEHGFAIEISGLVSKNDKHLMGKKRIADSMNEIYDSVFKRCREETSEQLYNKLKNITVQNDEDEEEIDEYGNGEINQQRERFEEMMEVREEEEENDDDDDQGQVLNVVYSLMNAVHQNNQFYEEL